MASLALQLKSHYTKPSQFLLKTTTSNFNFPHFFSSSSSSSSSNNNNNKNDDEKPSEKPYAFSGYFKDIKSKLKQHEEQQQLSPGFKPFNFTLTENTSSNQPSKDGDFSEIQKNLSEFRRRSTDFSSSPQSQQPNLYQTVGNMRSGGGRTVNLSFDSIRESLRKSGQKGSGMKDAMSLNMHKKSLNFQPVVGGGGKVIGGTTEDLPMNVFGEEMRARERGEGGGDGDDNLLNVELNRMYNHAELGEKLRELRPEVKGKKGKSDEAELFSLSELNERVKKLKEIEVKEMSDKSMGVAFKDLRRSIKSLKGGSDKQMNKNASLQGINLLPQPSLNAPPKENMIERYFHPDNMSSEEKMKLKLKTVRDEFKLHESDCGSTRVQIAQLTTEILHLSSVLHKKDKHSRRGLQAKVQQRKKLLKYLRRTDWESYTFVLSKLGLRDNPDYKN